MAWESLVSSAALTLTDSYVTVKDTGGSSDLVITLDPRELAQVQIEFNPQGSAAADAEWEVLTSPDGGTTWDVTPLISSRISNDQDPNRVTFHVAFVERFKIRGKQTPAGGGDTANTMTVRVRTDGVSA